MQALAVVRKIKHLAIGPALHEFLANKSEKVATSALDLIVYGQELQEIEVQLHAYRAFREILYSLEGPAAQREFLIEMAKNRHSFTYEYLITPLKERVDEEVIDTEKAE